MQHRSLEKYFNLILIFIILIGTNCSKKSDGIHVNNVFIKVGILDLFKPENVIISFEDKEMILEINNKKQIIIKNSFIIKKRQGSFVVESQGNEYEFGKAIVYTKNFNQFYGNFNIIIPNKISRNYFGGFECTTKNEQISLIVIQKLEDYVTSVISSESSNDSFEYLKAFSIVVRTFTSNNLGRHRDQGFDFCDNTHCQVFYGEDNKNQFYKNAVKSTENLFLVYKGKLVDVFYCGACGGTRFSPEYIWNNYQSTYPYQNIKCDYCSKSKYFKWNSSIGRNELSKFFFNENTDLEITQNDNPNTILQNVILKTKERSIELKPDDFRIMMGRNFGWKTILSNNFTLKVNKDSVYFIGNGFGHNTGFCQSGGEEMARIGKTYKEILNYYFEKNELKTGK